jgi:hypothetical protein
VSKEQAERAEHLIEALCTLTANVAAIMELLIDKGVVTAEEVERKVPKFTALLDQRIAEVVESKP